MVDVLKGNFDWKGKKEKVQKKIYVWWASVYTFTNLFHSHGMHANSIFQQM